MGNAVGIGLHLAGHADLAAQLLLFYRGNDHSVLLLQLGAHPDAARLTVFVMSLMAFFPFVMDSRLFFRVACLLMSGMLPVAAFVAGEPIEKAAPQG